MSRFYIGQEVVCVSGVNQPFMSEPLVKGKIYTVMETGSCCRKDCVAVGIGVRPPFEGICPGCHREFAPDEQLHFHDNCFAPLEEIEKEESLVMQEVYKILQPIEEPIIK